MKQVVEISNCQVLFLISKSWPKVGGMCVCKKRGLGSAPIWCSVAPCQHGDCCQEAAKWHFQSCASFVGVFNSWSHVFFCKFSCGHGGCCLLCASLTLWFPAQLALPGDLGHLNQGRGGRREAICQMSISMGLGRCPNARSCTFKLLSSGRGGGRGGGHHGQPPDAGGELERWASSSLSSHFLSPWNSTNIPLVLKTQ